jgi:hypothetical protein
MAQEADQTQDQEQDDDQQALRLMRAFYNVRDGEARRIIVALVEAAAQGASVKIEEPDELGMAILGFSGGSKSAPH